MKKIFYLLFLLPLAILGQTQTENYVVEKTYKKETTTPVLNNHIDSVNTVIQYFDGLGRAKQNIIVNGGKLKYANNEVPYDWSAGTPSNSGFYNLYGPNSDNQVVTGTTPFGDTDLLWECIPDSSVSADGGWNTDSFNIDTTEPYRYTIWVKKSGNLTDGGTFHGVGTVKDLSGNLITSAYFWAGDLPQIDTWYMLVGYVHPQDYTGGDLGISGVYDTNGNKVIDATEFKWSSTHSTTFFRNYLFGATNTSTRQYFWSPIFQKIDGTETPLNELTTEAIQYINLEADIKDIVTHFEYDSVGRQKREFLPYAVQANGALRNNAASETNAYYIENYATDMNANNPNPFSEKFFDNSPLNRIREQTAPGEAWEMGVVSPNSNNIDKHSNGNTIRYAYHSNLANEVKKFDAVTNLSGDIYSISLSGGTAYYQIGELIKTTTKDENWQLADGSNHTTEEFKNKQGQVILKRTYDAGVAHDTYYVYDKYGNLTYVLPPKMDADTNSLATINSELDDLGYQYKYDTRNRLVEKKIPGKDWEYIIYDKLDRPVMTQDANQRAASPKEWLFTKYDALGRVAITGVYDDASNRSRSSMQSYFNTAPRQIGGTSTLFETRNASEFSSTYVQHYYSNYNFPYQNIEILTVNYYDDYIFNLAGSTAPNAVNYTYEQTGTTAVISDHTKGLSTGSKVRVLGTNKWITNVTYYDQKARPIYIYTKNDALETTNIVESKLDFIGNALETKTNHQKTGQSDLVTIDYFEYDHQNRLIGQTQKINSQIPERIVHNNYDNLGQLESKLTGSGAQKGYKDVTSGLSINDDIITKTGANGWNEGLATLGSINGDGYIEFETGALNKYYMIGLSPDNPDAHYGTIDYAVYVAGTAVYIYESWINRGNLEASSIGDRFRVERIGNTIYYKKNGDVFYTSTVPSVGSLLGDISIHSIGTQIKDFHIVDNSKGLQNVDYTYNVRGWLKTINEDAVNDNDLFNFSLKYNDPSTGTALYNGNISQTSWSTASTQNPGAKTYTYSYDALNRITGATGDWSSNYNLSGISYDKNGNILSLQRKGHTGSSVITGFMDDLTYNYDTGNKLLKVSDNGSVTYGFFDGANLATEYTYDANGNMLTDVNKGITTNINYNHLNLPTQVSKSQNSVNYVYDATGGKLEKKVIEVSGFGASTATTTTTTMYAGNYVYQKSSYQQGMNMTSTDHGLQFMAHPEGYVKKDDNTYNYVYQYKDHLGNVRLSYADTDNDGNIDIETNGQDLDGDGITNEFEIIEESNYYPFGLKHKGYNNVVSANSNSVANKFKYNGKELQDELGLDMYDYGARMYDPAIGKWNGIDALAEVYHTDSPYTYVLNNPLSFIDPDGREVKGVTKKDAEKVHEDLNKAFADKKFDAVRALLTRGKRNNKKKFDKIDGDALKDALSGLSGDDLALAELVTGAINSDDVHTVEFVEPGDELSAAGTAGYNATFEKMYKDNGIPLPAGGFPSRKGKDVQATGGSGQNFPTADGSHSVILIGSGVNYGADSNRTTTTFHEVFGHGIPSAKKTSDAVNNANAIRTENLVRRVLGIQAQRDGSGHAGGKIQTPSALPTVKN